MSFENVAITSTRGGTNPITGWRQDLAQGDSIGLSLTSNAGVTSYNWLLVGRPEGSTAGGTGPEPVVLSTAATASFTVDADGAFTLDGTYIIHCVVNGGSPTEAIIKVGLARLSAFTTPDGRPLRKIGAGEVDEDTSVANRAQGYATMLDRWLGMIGVGGLSIVVLTDTSNPLILPPETNYARGTIGLVFGGSSPLTPSVYLKSGTTNLTTDWIRFNITAALTETVDPTLSAPTATSYFPGTIGFVAGDCSGPDRYFLCCGDSTSSASWLDLSLLPAVVAPH